MKMCIAGGSTFLSQEILRAASYLETKSIFLVILMRAVKINLITISGKNILITEH